MDALKGEGPATVLIGDVGRKEEPRRGTAGAARLDSKGVEVAERGMADDQVTVVDCGSDGGWVEGRDGLVNLSGMLKEWKPDDEGKPFCEWGIL